MGSSTFLDIIGSFIIGGLLLLILWRVNASATENLYVNNGELVVQENLASVVSVLEHDLRKIGYCKDWTKIPDPSIAIISADSSSLKFIGDIDNNSYVDTLHYYVGPVSALTKTPNPNDRYLYRVLNDDTPHGINSGITEFKLSYYDALGNKISTPVANTKLIQFIEFNIRVENTDAYDSQYSTAFWQQKKLTSKNLSNR